MASALRVGWRIGLGILGIGGFGAFENKFEDEDEDEDEDELEVEN